MGDARRSLALSAVARGCLALLALSLIGLAHPRLAPADLVRGAPSVSVNGSGKVLVAWSEQGTDGRASVLAAVGRLGGRMGRPRTIAVGLPDVLPYVSGGLDSVTGFLADDGEALVVWEDSQISRYEGTIRSRINVALTRPGRDWRTQTLAHTGSPFIDDASMAPDGTAVVTWQQQGVTLAAGHVADSDGFASPQRLTDYTDGADVTVASAGRALFSGRRCDTSDRSMCEVIATTVDHGAVTKEVLPRGIDRGSNGQPLLAANGAAALWFQPRLFVRPVGGTFGQPEIYGGPRPGDALRDPQLALGIDDAGTLTGAVIQEPISGGYRLDIDRQPVAATAFAPLPAPAGASADCCFSQVRLAVAPSGSTTVALLHNDELWATQLTGSAVESRLRRISQLDHDADTPNAAASDTGAAIAWFDRSPSRDTVAVRDLHNNITWELGSRPGESTNGFLIDPVRISRGIGRFTVYCNVAAGCQGVVRITSPGAHPRIYGTASYRIPAGQQARKIPVHVRLPGGRDRVAIKTYSRTKAGHLIRDGDAIDAWIAM